MYNVALQPNVNFIQPVRITPKADTSSRLIYFKGIDKDVFISTIPNIVKLTKKDFNAIYPLYLKYRESANIKSSLKEVKQFLLAEAKRTDDEFYVAKIGNRLAGFLHFGKEFSTLNAAERIRIKAMYVDEEYRGKGVAKKLINKLKEENIDKDIIVKARRTNEHSPFLYRNSGFNEDSSYIHFIYPATKK